MRLGDPQRGIDYTNFKIEGLGEKQQGKVRDVYTLLPDGLVIVATDRISAFDHVLPQVIPYKGEILNQMAARAFEQTAHIMPNWLFEVPDPAVSMGCYCKPIPVEFVVRAYLCGHAARVYEAGGRSLCGVPLPEGLRRNDPLPAPILTPTTKANNGHDEDIRPEAIVEQGILDRDTLAYLSDCAMQLFEAGQRQASIHGLIMADTKYEFGSLNGAYMLIDEVHTPDSSRFFYAEGYEQRQEAGQAQKQLSKEFVREWLMEQGFNGMEGQSIPEMSLDTVEKIQERYFELYRQMTGEVFRPTDRSRWQERLHDNIAAGIEKWRQYA